MSTSVGTGFLTWLFPRFDAAVSPEFYRQSGKLRALTNLVFLVSNLVIAPRVESLGFDPRVHWRVVVAYSCIHTLDGALALWLWRGRTTLRGMRVLTYVGVVLEALAVVAAAWVYGSVNSPFLGIELVVLVVYRFWFDFRVGFVAFALTLVGQWLVVVLEISGVLPSQPMAGASVDKVYLIPSREIGAMLYLTFVYLLTFAVVNWSVGRLRHKDVAIRLLREQLFADKGKLGRHTGRTLRDTYALGGLLGSGGMGEVYIATHLRTQRRVAVKMLHTHLVEDRTVLSRFRREAAVTGQLGSEHIVGVIDVDEDEGQPYIVLELVDGISLEARIRGQGALSFDLVADVVDQIARGLDVAHKAGVIHRDLKPENLLLCDRAEGGLLVKILDFGVSKIHGSATAITQEAAMLGTPDFMSPEQAQGNADTVDASSDVFALGGVAYTCITGQRPFRAESVPAVLRRICEQEPPPIATLRADVPPGVADVIAIALAKSPSDRYASTIELARDLRAALSGQLDPAVAERAARITRGRPSDQRLETPKQIDVTGETQPR